MGPGNTRVRPYKGGSFALRKLNMDASQAEFIFLVQFFLLNLTYEVVLTNATSLKWLTALFSGEKWDTNTP